MAKISKPEKAKKSLFTLDEGNRRKLKVASALTGLTMQDIVNEALEDWFLKYEKKNGEIPVK